MKNELFIINRQEYTVDGFFKEILDDLVILDPGYYYKSGDKEYEVVRMQTTGQEVDSSIQFYILEENLTNKPKFIQVSKNRVINVDQISNFVTKSSCLKIKLIDNDFVNISYPYGHKVFEVLKEILEVKQIDE
jgi:hypothetical protein